MKNRLRKIEEKPYQGWHPLVRQRVKLPIAPQGAEESCLTVMLAQFIAQLDLVIQNNERD